jgi:hypothetical protein
MLMQPSSSDQGEALQMTQAAQIRKLVVYVDESYYFLVCRTRRTALPLSRIPQHFGNQRITIVSAEIAFLTAADFEKRQSSRKRRGVNVGRLPGDLALVKRRLFQ